MADQDGSPNLDDLTPEEASRIIHAHRKVRYGTACWPCRQRKVKCDNKQPCENCVKRDHAQLCSYKPNRSSSGSKHGASTADANQTRKRAHSPETHDGGHSQNERPRDGSIQVDRDYSADVTRYLGQNSIPALLREQTVPSDQGEGAEELRQDMRSILGLDNSAPFPLMSSRHMDRLLVDITAELPSDREVMKLFRTYKDIPQLFWGFVLDIDDMESRLMIYLEERAKNAKNSTRPNKPVAASWLAILFAVLAVGSQYHDSPYHIRTKDSQNYIQISFHFLRLSNYLLRPNLDSIQALLMTGFVLLNDMKAEASWALLGVTCRLAQSLGLDRATQLDGKESPATRSKEMARRKLWWTCLWHDALTSLSFDRTPISCGTCPIPILDHEGEGWSYLEGMYHLCQIITKRLNPEAAASISYLQILDNCQAVEDIRIKMIPHLRNKELCKTALDRLQHFAFRLHTSYVVSVCCRPALRREENSILNKEQKRLLAQRCKDNLTETVRMFLAMHQLSVIPTRSWAFTYHGLSSAVLLGILGETKADLEVRQLQGDLIDALSATAAKDLTSPTHIQKTDKDIELSGPLSRALAALKNIYDHGSVIFKGVKRESGTASGARTPLQLSQNGGQTTEMQRALSSIRNTSAGNLDPHQDAALAMTEMQNGSNLSDFSGNLAFAPQMQVGDVELNDMANLDPATYMSPMDLYSQIMWESPDPWNTGNMDSMNFDFVAQPPPGQAQQQFYF